ncbi:hypothetical protein JCM10450v2_006955 [Rhodotorula kratochvilovae]
MIAPRTPRKDSSWSRSLRDSDDDSCDDAAPPPRSSRQKRTRTTSSDADGFTWGAGSDAVDIGLVSEPAGLKFVETPFTLAKRTGARGNCGGGTDGKGGRRSAATQQPPRSATNTAPLKPSQPLKPPPTTTTHKTPVMLTATAPVDPPHSSSPLHIRTDSPSPEVPSFQAPLLRPKAIRPAKPFVSPVRSVKQLPPPVKPASAPLAAPTALLATVLPVLHDTPRGRLAFAPAESLAAFRARMAGASAALSPSSSTGAAGPTSGGRKRARDAAGAEAGGGR